MTAAVLYGKEDVKIERVPIPTLEEGEILIKVQVALTCGTDLKVYQRGYHARMIVPPALFGHELAGVIEEVGPNVKGFKKGQRVVALNSAPLRPVLLLLQAPGKSLRRSALQQWSVCGIHSHPTPDCREQRAGHAQARQL